MVEEVASRRSGDGGGGNAEEGFVLPPEIAAAHANGNGRDRVWERAMAEVRAGRTQRAIEMLSGELDRETSQRGRFLRRAQLAHLLVETGFDAVATPLLEQMVEQIDTLKLDEWESGPVAAQPMALLYRCLEKAAGDEDTMYNLYLRMCRLDPIQAISIKRP